MKAEQGVGIVGNRKNRNHVKISSRNLKNLKFSEYYEKHKEFMNTISIEQLDKIF